MLSSQVNVLIVDHSESDACAISLELRKAGFDLAVHRVESESEFRAHLEPAPDIILSEYHLPQFGALRAMQIAREGLSDIPFLIVSGTISEEAAISAMQNGASDYLLKDRLGRLGMAVAQAITQRRLREAERQARRAEMEAAERLKFVLAAAKMGVWEWDLVTSSVYWSPECLEIVGLTEFDGTYATAQSFTHPDDVEHLNASITSAIEARTRFVLEFRIIRRDGEIRWISNIGRCEYDTNGAPKRLLGSIQDITDRKIAERAIADSEARYRLALDATEQGTWRYDFPTDEIWLDETCQRHHGVNRSYVKPSELFATIHPDDAARLVAVATVAHDSIEGDGSFTIEYRLDRPYGRVHWLAVLARFRFSDSPGQRVPLQINGVTRDITEFKAVEFALRTSEERFQLALRGANEGLWDWDMKTNELFLSPRWKSMLGYEDEEVCDRYDTWLDLMHRDDRAAAAARLREFIDGPSENYESEFRMRHKSGEYRNILSRGFMIRDEEGIPARMVGTHQNITERKLADEELRASRQRLEALSRQLISTRETELRHLARELHDEIGQMLTAMKMNLRSIQRSVDANLHGRLEENVSMIDHAVQQVRNLALNMRPPHLDGLGLAATLHWYLKNQAMIAGFQERLTVIPAEIQVPPDLATVCFRITQEAVTNAVRHASARQVEIELRQDNEELYLAIRDNGVGFDVADARSRAAGGASLGLISMQERASLAGGRIEIESTRGLGTTIHAWFPLSPS